jgi:thiol-disulfide isomerase/thioredoxin
MALLLAAALALGAGEPLALVGAGGERVTLAPAPGEDALLVHFWASWCVDCGRELPELQDAARACEGARVRVVTVNVGEDEATVERFRAERGVVLPVLRDPRGGVWRSVARGLPANLVWTAAGRESDVGPRDRAAWAHALAELGCRAGAPER